MKLKAIITVFLCCCIPIIGYGQLLKNLERKINNKIEESSERILNKGIENAEGKILNIETKKDKKKKKGESENLSEAHNGVFNTGNKIILFDDFKSIKEGAFPNTWSTSTNGKIVSLTDFEGKWLKIPDNTTTYPKIGELPENFTIEFDLIYPQKGERPPITFGFTDEKNPAKNAVKNKKLMYFIIPSGDTKENVGYSYSWYSGKETTQYWKTNSMVNSVVKVAISMVDNQLRLFLNNEKIFEVSDAFHDPSYRNNFHFRASPVIPKSTDGFYISNLKIAEIVGEKGYDPDSI